MNKNDDDGSAPVREPRKPKRPPFAEPVRRPEPELVPA